MSVPTEATERWSDALLDAARQQTDPPADRVVAELFATGEAVAVNGLMRTLVENDGLPPDALPPVVRDYLASSAAMPSWADPQRIEAGERVFWRYGPAVIAILHCYSLPFCYAAAKGVRVLALTARLSTNPTRRIVETAQMVVDVMRPGGLGAVGTGIRTTQKVRLMHAAVRFLIGRYDGWKPEWDKPINQEDMVGTLLSFSWSTLDGLRRLGYGITDDEAEGYLHCWKVTGHILGIRPELFPNDYADAEALARRIQQRQYGACEEGRMMTAALVGMMQHYIPGNALDGLPPVLIRYFLGDSVAGILGVEAGDATRALIEPMKLIGRLKSDLVHSSEDFARVHELFGRALIEGIMLVGRGGKRIPFTIPTELLQAWGVNWLP
jgi:ER-bound oxygenase mpaB/B'/Rubber oxygenase, catalytic domain